MSFVATQTDTEKCHRCGGMFSPNSGREVIVRVLPATHLDPPEEVWGFMCHECADAWEGLNGNTREEKPGVEQDRW